MITKEKVECYNCGEEILREEGYEYKDGYLCQTCFCDEFFTCENCGSLTSQSDCKVVNPHLENRMYVCTDCANSFQVCSHCDSLITHSEVWASDSEELICNNCSSYYTICNECRCIVHEDDAYYSDGYDYCQDCYDNLGSDYIEDYSYKPEPEFLGETDEGLYLGIELEVDCGNNLQSTTKRIYDEFADVYMKHDGSLTSGIIDIKTRKGVSDTMTYITERLAKRYKWDKEFYKSRKQRKVIQTEIGSSKMAFLDHNGGIYTVGDFIEDNGILYSNSSYMERDYFFKLSWEDYTDYEQVTPLYEGYVVTKSRMYEIEDANYFIGKGGKLFEYDYYLDVCFETEGVAYTTSGFVATFNEDESIWMNVMR